MFLFFALFIFALALYVSCAFRICVSHPFQTIVYGIRDGYRYIRYRRWNECPTGKIICYSALFGKGKTLSGVHDVVDLFNRYNDKRIYDFIRKKWVTQKIFILSNVELKGIPFEYFISLEQVVRVAEKFRINDYANDTLTCTIIFGDEFSVQMNSREFKKNMNPLFLNTLLTCRHHHISLIYDAQRFNHVDALLRQVTSYVIECDKKWRFMQHYYYDAFALENATEPALVKPYKSTGFFIKNKHYNSYDTLACVGNLKKYFDADDMLSESDILDLQRNQGVNMDGVLKPSRKFRRMRKRIS